MKIKFNFSKRFNKIGVKIFKAKLARRIMWGLGIFVLALAGLFLTFNISYQNKILPKTYIGSTNFGGMSREEAKTKLNSLIETNKSGQLSFEWAGQSYLLPTSDLEVNYSTTTEKSLDGLFGVGRTGGLGEILAEQFKVLYGKNQVLADYTFKEDVLDAYLSNIAKVVDKPEKDATIIFQNEVPVVTSEETGQQFPLDDNKKIARQTIGEFSFSTKTPFSVLTLVPKITFAMAEQALSKTRELMVKKLKLTGRDKTFDLSTKDVQGMIGFVAHGSSLEPEFSVAGVGAYLDSVSPEINQEAQDAKFQVVGGKVSAFSVAKTGYGLDKVKAVTMVIEAFNSGTATLELPIKVTEPSISGDASQNGIKELIAEGKTSWRGSPANRIHNLTFGSSKISGTMVKPGEEFSTVHTLSPITASGGYLPELVIKNSTKVEPDIGGGLCQVSTTLFRAVINSGLKVTARTAHSFRVSYYEPPVGMDATVFDPAPDFKFVNNMDTPILIWAYAGSNSLTFQIYGTKDGRNVSISDPVKYNYVSPPGPVYSESSSMATGAIRQVERATAGVSATFTYKVTSAAGKVLESDTFVSKYVPIPDTYIYGPGTTGIPGVEGVSTQATPTPPTSPTPFIKVVPTPKS